MSVSIIIPCYNSEAFLEKTLTSLLHQTWQDWEALCIDDGSADGTLAILQEWARQDARFIVIPKPNGGIESAIKAGLPHISKDFTYLHGHDDWLEPDALALALDEFAKNPELDAVRMTVQLDYPDRPSEIFQDDVVTDTGLNTFRQTIIEWHTQTFALWRSRIFQHMADVDGHGMMNYDELATRYLLTRCRMTGRTKGKYHYIQHGDAVTKKLTPRRLDAFAMQALIKRLLQQLEIYPEFQERFEPWLVENFRRAVALTRQLEKDGQPLGPAEWKKLELLQQAIDFHFVSRDFSFFKKLKYRQLFSRFNWHVAYLRHKYRKS